MKRLAVLAFMLSAVLVLGCNENAPEPNLGAVSQLLVPAESVPVPVVEPPRRVIRTFYVAPANGLILRAGPGVANARILAFPQFTRLDVFGRSAARETINGINGYWYEVGAAGETGWVFGGYLMSSLPREDMVLGMPVFSEAEGTFTFSNGVVRRWCRDSTQIGFDIGFIRVYERTSRESGYVELRDARVNFFRLEGIENWLFMFNDEIHGFVFLYDIPALFDWEETEVELLANHDNFKRFGPVLIVHYNYNIFRFESFPVYESRQTEPIYLLLGYFPEYGEIFINRQRWPGDRSEQSLFDLELGEYTARDIGRYPSFSPTRDYIISLHQISYIVAHDNFAWNVSSLRVFSRDGRHYGMIFEMPVDFKNSAINGITWLDHNNVRIEYGESGVAGGRRRR